MFDRYTDRARKVLGHARQVAPAGVIASEHILWGLLHERSSVAANVLRNLDVDIQAILSSLRRVVPKDCPSPVGEPPYTANAHLVLRVAAMEADTLGHNYVGTEHLLLALLRVGHSTAGQVLSDLGMGFSDTRDEVNDLLGGPPAPAPPAAKPSRTPALDTFTRDLVTAALEGELEGVVRRDRECEDLLATLTRRHRANALLVGPEGVGRRSLVHELAFAIATGREPAGLRGARLAQLDTGLLMAGTKNRGQLEERVKAICDECKATANVFLVIEDFEAVLSWPTSRGKTRLLRQFMPALEAGDMRCIGRISADDYEEHVLAAPEVARLFGVVPVAAPDGDLLQRILGSSALGLEEHHDVRVTDEALTAAIACSEDDVVEQPLAALTLLDRTCAAVGEGVRRLPELLLALNESIQSLLEMKQEAVAAQEYEQAAAFLQAVERDVRDRDIALREWTETQSLRRTVDASLVEKTAARTVTPATPPARAAGPRPASEFERLQAWSVLPPAKVNVEEETALVLLPDGKVYDCLYTVAIQPALAAHGITAIRPLDLYHPLGRLAGTADLLRSAEIIVADASGRDAGVACALGMALTLGRAPLLLVHDEGDLPGSLRTLHSLAYDPLDLKTLRGRLTGALVERLTTTLTGSSA